MTRRERMQTGVVTRKLTYSDYLLLPDDGRRHELIDGKEYITTSPATVHQRILRRLAFDMEAWLRAHPAGEMFFAPFDVVLSDFDVVVPDLIYVSPETAASIDERGLFAAPDLVVEILSPSTRRRDDGIKRRLYERVAVKEYWLLDPAARTAKVFRSEDGRFHTPVVLGADEDAVLTTSVIPGLTIRLVELFK